MCTSVRCAPALHRPRAGGREMRGLRRPDAWPKARPERRSRGRMSADEFGTRPGEVAASLPATLRCRPPLHRPAPHALDGRGRLPEERTADRRDLHREVDPPTRPACRTSRAARHLILLYWMDRADPRPPGSTPPARRRPPRHLLAALARASEPDRPVGGRVDRPRGRDLARARARLPRRHAAPRHQAVLRHDRLPSGRADRPRRGRAP